MTTNQSRALTPLTPRLGLVLLFLLSAAIRLAWWEIGPRVIEHEGTHYARLGENIAAGRGYVGLHELGLQLLYPPLYPGLIAAGTRLGLSSETAGRMVSLLFGFCTPIIACLIARRMYGAASGWLAGVVAAGHPLLVVASTAVLSESTYITLSLLAIYFVLDAFESKRSAMFGGLSLGLAYLCRPEALMLSLVLAAIIVMTNRDRWRQAATRALTMLAVVVVFAVPYITFLRINTGQFRVETKTPQGIIYQLDEESGANGMEIFFGIDKDLVEKGLSNTSDLEQMRYPQPSRMHQARLLLRQSRRNAPRLLRALGALQLGMPFLVALAAVGLFATPWKQARVRNELPLLAVVALIVFPFLAWPLVLDRALFMLLSPLIVWSGIGLDRLRLWIQDTIENVGLSASARAVLVAAVVATPVALVFAAAAVGVRQSDEMSQSWTLPPQEIEIGRWLRTQGSSIRVMDDRSTIPFYSGAVQVAYPWTDSATALRYVDHKRVSYLVLRQSDAGRRPYIAEWLQHPDSRLELVRSFDVASDVTRIYRWRSDKK
jgi:4-amino-4-deoxy-L-arabinose transferase-like glycosyltransferase